MSLAQHILDGKLVREIQLLKESRAVAVEQEQRSRVECNRIRVELEELRIALEESVKLQGHYAKLLNMHDGGERRAFSGADAWIARLRVCGTIPPRA